MTKQGVPHEHKGARYMNSEEIVLSLRKNKHFFFQVSIVVLIIGTVAGAQLFQNKDTNLAKDVYKRQHMDRDTNGSRLISDSASYCLTNPPGCIGRKFETFIWIEFLNCTK